MLRAVRSRLLPGLAALLGLGLAVTGLLLSQQPAPGSEKGRFEPARGLGRMDESLQRLGGSLRDQDEVDVFLILERQPQREILTKHTALRAPRRAAVLERLSRLRAAGAARGPRQSEFLDAQAQLDAIEIETRRAAFAEIEQEIGPQQRAVSNRLRGFGAARLQSYRFINMLAATLPARSLANLSADPEILHIGLAGEKYSAIASSVHAINTSALWQAGLFGNGQSVAVLDTGIRAEHPSFKGTQVVARVFHDGSRGRLCYADDPTTPADMNGHGSHVAGTVTAREFAGYTGYNGVAPGLSQLISLKVGHQQRPRSFDSRCSGSGSFADADTFTGIDWLLSNTPTKILNYSVGGTTDTDDDTSVRLFDYLADTYGLTIAIAAGNSGPGAKTVNSPGNAYNVITVANMDHRGTVDRGDDRVTNSSSRGPTAGGRYKPDLAAPGTNILAADYRTDTLVSKTGTSMATPHVAGASALLHEAGITDVRAIKALMINTSGFAGWRDDRGWGYINMANLAANPTNLMASVAPAGKQGGVRYFTATNAGILIATMSWNRHVAFNGGQMTVSFHDLDLFLYGRDNNGLLHKSSEAIQNIEQVITNVPGPVVLKVKSSMTEFGMGLESEQFALAVNDSGIKPVNGPALNLSCTAPGSVAPGASFAVRCSVANNGDLDLFGVRVSLTLPAGVNGRNAESLGNVAAGAAVERIFNFTAPVNTGPLTLPFRADSGTYGEQMTAPSPVTINVGGAAVTSLLVDRNSIDLRAVAGSSAAVRQEVALSSGNTALSFTAAASGGAWLSVSPASGTTPARLAVSANPAGLQAGVYRGSVTLNAQGSQTVIGVTLRVDSSAAPRVTLGRVVFSKVAPDSTGCNEPPAATSFVTSDPHAFLWFNVTGAAAGDRASVEYIAPDGQQFKSGAWNPLPSAGNWCFQDSLAIAEQPAASMPGTWTVRVLWNGAELFSRPLQIGSTATVERRMTTAALAQGSGCPVPEPLDTFTNTAERVYLWFLVGETSAGDRARVEWVRPDGTVYRNAAWNPLASGGRWCFNHDILIAGEEPARLTGKWSAKVYWNNNLLFTQEFTIRPDVTIEKRLITRDIPEEGKGCVAPEANSTISFKDDQAVLWFSAAGARTGATVAADWYQPDGQLYETIEWDPLDEGGDYCFWAWMYVAGEDAAAKPGEWKVTVRWNNQPVFTETFTITPILVEDRRMTKTRPEPLCSQPVSTDSFAPSDERAFLWFIVDETRAGGVARADWLDPNGTVQRRSVFDPIDEGGRWCFLASLPIAGQPAAQQQGKWRVRLHWNDVPLFTSEFEIGTGSAPGGGSTGSLEIGQNRTLLAIPTAADPAEGRARTSGPASPATATVPQSGGGKRRGGAYRSGGGFK